MEDVAGAIPTLCFLRLVISRQLPTTTPFHGIIDRSLTAALRHRHAFPALPQLAAIDLNCWSGSYQPPVQIAY